MESSVNGVPLLAVENISIDYLRGRKKTKAVEGVEFEILQGETLGLVGESGSGKTTIGRAIQGLLKVSSGEIRLNGKNIESIKKNRSRVIAKEIQTIFQDPFGSLNPVRSIGSTLMESLEIHERLLSKTQMKTRVQSELERVGISPEATERFPFEFSGGQRQRIAIARALIAKPRLVICDEAVSALDLSIQAQILNLLNEIQQERGLSYLFISHDLAVVRHIADRILVLNAGKVVDSLDAKHFEVTQASLYTQRLFASAPVPNPQEQKKRRASFENHYQTNN